MAIPTTLQIVPHHFPVKARTMSNKKLRARERETVLYSQLSTGTSTHEREKRIGRSTHLLSHTVRLIVSDDCLRIMAETHNSDYNACSSNNAMTSHEPTMYVNVLHHDARRRVRLTLTPPFRLFRNTFVPNYPLPLSFNFFSTTSNSVSRLHFKYFLGNSMYCSTFITRKFAFCCVDC